MTHTTPKPDEGISYSRKDWWPCACVKRKRDGTLKAIKLHPQITVVCRVCGVPRPIRNAVTKGEG